MLPHWAVSPSLIRFAGCVVSLDDIQFRVDLIVLVMSEFDIILGMDWLESYHVSINCFDKTVCLRLPGQPEFVIATSQRNSLAEAYLAYIDDALPRDQSVTLAETRVVFEFEDIFQDIPGLPPRREVEFCIVLLALCLFLGHLIVWVQQS